MSSASARSDGVLLDVFHAERAALAAFFLRSAGDRPCAEDLLQDTFIQVWSHRHRLSADSADGASMKRYLWRTARNRMIDEIRARQRRRGREAMERPGQETASGAGRSFDPVEWQDCLRVVRDTAHRVKNRDARNCLLMWLEGRGIEETAAALSLPVGRVRGLLQRARAEVIRRAAGRLQARPGSDR